MMLGMLLVGVILPAALHAQESDTYGRRFLVAFPDTSHVRTEIVNPLVDAGFAIQRLVEPIPTEEFRRQKPESYARILRQPNFLILLARPLVR
jgi:hypothetical protein